VHGPKKKKNSARPLSWTPDCSKSISTTNQPNTPNNCNGSGGGGLGGQGAIGGLAGGAMHCGAHCELADCEKVLMECSQTLATAHSSTLAVVAQLHSSTTMEPDLQHKAQHIMHIGSLAVQARRPYGAKTKPSMGKTTNHRENRVQQQAQHKNKKMEKQYTHIQCSKKKKNKKKQKQL